MNSLEYTNIQGFKLAMSALLGETFLPVQRPCKKKAKFSYRFCDPGRTSTLRALVIPLVIMAKKPSYKIFFNWPELPLRLQAPAGTERTGVS